MKFEHFIIACIALVYALFLIASPRATTVSAEPHAQATEEPTKRPYVFPTPVFIPTYADDTPAPRRTPIATIVPGATGEQTYTVESGDSLWVIATKVYGDGTKYKLIMEANGLTDPTLLRVGTALRIPSLDGSPRPTVSAPASSAPVIVPTQEQPFVLATAVPVPTAVSSRTTEPESKPMTDNFQTIINLISGLFFIGALVAGVLAYLMYLRARRLEKYSSNKQPIRIKQ